MELRRANTADIVSQIRNRVNAGMRKALPNGTQVQAASEDVLPLQLVTELVARCRENSGTIGHVPAGPNTFRARIGARIIRLMRRALFWYTPQITAYNALVADTLAETAGVLRNAYGHIAAVRDGANATDARIDKVESLLRESEAAQRDQVASAQSEVASLKSQIASTHSEIAALKSQVASLEQQMTSTQKQLAAHLAARFDNVERSVEYLRRELMLQQQRSAGTTSEAQRPYRANEPAAAPITAIASESDRFHDALYASFEDVFRGAREDIKDRLRVYLPHLRAAGVGGFGMPALDLGCGRGEWLELLGDEGLHAAGVDSNRVFVHECVGRGLHVTESDMLSFLRDVPSASVGIVTGFHVVEHVPLEPLLAILDETVRVLKPGGVAIFETPNPANLMVGANTFYYDPTHRHPLPSPLLKFLVEARGLSRAEILPLHPAAEALRVADDGSALVSRFNEYFYGPQDYAVIGFKV